MTQLHQLDFFGGEKAHDIVVKERRENEYRERLRQDPAFARRALILGCLNRRGPMTEERVAELLGMALIDVQAHVHELRQKGLVVEVDEVAARNGRRVWVWRATAKREEGA